MNSKMRSLSLLLAAAGFAQSPEPLNWTTEQDHRVLLLHPGWRVPVGTGAGHRDRRVAHRTRRVRPDSGPNVIHASVTL